MLGGPAPLYNPEPCFTEASWEFSQGANFSGWKQTEETVQATPKAQPSLELFVLLIFIDLCSLVSVIQKLERGRKSISISVTVGNCNAV